jgi:L-ascorbate metabolism protein UlaG (beta-lactamase superfamily)
LPSVNSRAACIKASIGKLVRRLRIAAIAVSVVFAIVIGIVTWLWQDRDDISDLEWPLAATAAEPGESVTITWLGVTTLLIDDNETQLLIDGFFSRFGVLDYLFREVSTDIANVNYVMAEFHINRLAAIIPAHSHFDHAMDVGIVANRSSAVVLGSESTANIARGADLPVNQYQILANREVRTFGNFTITLIASRHAPIADGKNPWFPGLITEPLRQPAKISEWKEGQSYSILIGHPRGTTLIQGSAGYIEDNLTDVSADVVVLGIGGLSGLGKTYAEQYWNETVTATGARRVYPVHYDDFTQSFGKVMLFPKIADDSVKAADWINDAAMLEEDPPDIRLLPFGQPVILY